jgi:hypothetical protein
MYVLRSLHYFLLVSSFYELVSPLTLGVVVNGRKDPFIFLPSSQD